MIRKFARFNIYLSAALVLALAAGCHSVSKDKKEQKVKEAFVDLHQESSFSGGSDSENVPILRDHPVYVTVDKEPFLDSADVTEAKVLEDMGSFVLQLRLNWRGQQILGGVTTANRGKRIAIHCAFYNGKKNESRWLAAPVVNSPINNGLLTFTPDASREEADLIAKGINLEAKQLKKKDEF